MAKLKYHGGRDSNSAAQGGKVGRQRQGDSANLPGVCHHRVDLLPLGPRTALI